MYSFVLSGNLIELQDLVDLFQTSREIRPGQRKCRVKYFGLFFSENLGLQKTSSTIVGTDTDWKIRCPNSPANGHLQESPLGELSI